MYKLLAALACAAWAGLAQAGSALDTYKRLGSGGIEAPDARQAAEERKLIADPSALLAELEQQFFAAPSIESLAWFGAVAEDAAELARQRRMRATTPAWLPRARARWRTMIAHLERGWTPGAPWPRFGTLAYAHVQPGQVGGLGREMAPAVEPWLPATVPSLLKTDREAYFVAGEPLTKRRLLRGGTPGSVEYVAELSDAASPEDTSTAPSSAGDFRSVNGFVEFLKGQGQSPKIRFRHRGDYGIDGLLGTVGAEVAAPASVAVLAVLRDGAAAGKRLRVAEKRRGCGVDQSVVIGFDAPPKSAPLAYVATFTAVDPAKVTVAPLGTVAVADPYRDATTRPWRITGFRVDLDGDGRADLVIVQGRGPAELATSGHYHAEDALLSVVYANIGGRWKRVAEAEETGCT